MRVHKKELLVIVVRGQTMHCGLYRVMRGLPHILITNEQLFPDDVMHNTHIYNIAAVTDAIRHFLPQNKHSITTILCFDDENTHEIIQKTAQQAEDEKIATKYGSLRLSSCCDPLQRMYVWRCAYHLIIQYTLLLTLLRCRLISMTLPLQSLIYLNHRYGEKKHLLPFDDAHVKRAELEKRSVGLLRTQLSGIIPQGSGTLLPLYSFASACIGAGIS